jgi:hypothetical protein
MIQQMRDIFVNNLSIWQVILVIVALVVLGFGARKLMQLGAEEAPMKQQISDMLKKNGGNVLLGILVLAIIAVLFYAFIAVINASRGLPTETSLPLLAIGGVIMLIGVLTVVAIIFSILGLADEGQAMGLPEGSIRAVIALSLIVLFAILAVFLYEGVSGTSGPVNTVENLSDAERAAFLRDHATARDLQAVLVKDKEGQPLKNPDGTPKYVYNVTYRSANLTSDDFAKQLLVLLGTLMTAITSFYLGAGMATSAAAAAAPTTDLVSPPPTVSTTDPTVHSIGNDGPVIHLKVMGNNLNIITHVKIVRGGLQVIGTNVGSNPTRVTCDIAVNTAITPPGGLPWDIVVDDGASKSATLPGALTINP